MLKVRKNNVGFSLLEVTVAIAVLGLCLSVILKIFTSTTRAARLASDYYNAMQIAETQMALLSVRKELVGVSEGEVDDYYLWEARVEEYEFDLNESLLKESPVIDSTNVLAAYHFDVQVSWGGERERTYRLSTVQLGQK